LKEKNTNHFVPKQQKQIQTERIFLSPIIKINCLESKTLAFPDPKKILKCCFQGFSFFFISTIKQIFPGRSRIIVMDPEPKLKPLRDMV
jgi:hypothetical protein